MAQDKRLTDVDTIAFQGGMDTYHEPGLLAPGSLSALQNMRQMHPGLKQRAGYIKKHSTADSTNGVMSMFQFSKGKRTERHFYAQMTDGDVLEATDAPPTVTTGAFGSEVFDGSSGTIPASWSVLNDLLIYSNGVDQHQICAGTTQNVQAFFENDMDGAEELMTIPNPPETAWAAGSTVTGLISKQQCTIVKSLTPSSYYIKNRTGEFPVNGETFTDGTITGSGIAVLASLTAMSDIPEEGINYTSQMTDSSSSTVAVLDSLSSMRFSEGATYSAMAKTVAGNITETTLTGTGTAFLTTLKVGQPINIHAAGVLTFDGTPSDGDTITLDTKTYTFKTTLTPSEGEVLIGGSAFYSRNNLVSAIMHTGTPDTDYKCAAAHPTCGAYRGNDNVTLTAYYLTAGTAGNVITTTENGTHTQWAAGTLLGGAESNVIDTITSNTVATVKTAWAATFSGGVLKTTHDCILVLAPIMPSHLTWTVSKPNGTVSTALISYYTATGWKNLTITDNTASSSKTLAQTGTMTWTTPTDAVPNYMYGLNGFWLKIAFTAELDAEVEISSLTYGSAWNSIQNVWDGGLVDAVEAIFYDASGGTSTTTFQNKLTYKATVGSGEGVGNAISYPLSIRPTAQKPAMRSFLYGTTAIAIGGMDSDNDLLYFSSADPIIGVYIDVGPTPNTVAATTIDQFEYLSTSGAWKTVGTFTDNTNGLANSGYVTFNRPADISPVTYNSGTYNAYWYRFGLGGADCAASVTIGIQVIPYYDINDFGKGLCNAVWEHRAVYVFDKNPNYIYLSTPDMPQVLSGSESGIFPVGDGRQNKIVCMKNFYDALLIFQEEKGAGGGCVSLLTKSDEDGAIGNMTSLSTYYGTMNANCVEVIEAIEGGHRAFFLSRNGVMMTDGKSVSFVPNFDKIKNYFDTTDTGDCIRTGYESKMYLKYDSVFHVLKIGLTTGASATNNNVFLVYDLHTSDWSLDSYANNFQCECEADAGSGNAPVVHLAGGQADGTVYILNSGVNDITAAVSSFATIELSNKGRKIRNCELVTRVKTQTAGNMTIDVYRNGVNDPSKQLTRSLTAERTNDRIRRHRDNINWVDQNLSVKFAHSAVDEGFYLLDYGVKLDEYSEQ